MKRFLSIALALSLIAGMMSGLTLTATAETVISDIAITGVTAPVVGQEPTTAGISTSAAYTQDIYWSVYDSANGGWNGINDGDTFANGKVYRLDITLWTNDGYSFEDWRDLTVTVNGNAITDFDSDYEWARFELIYIMDGVTVLDQVTIGNLPAVQAGTSTDLSGITSGANYAVRTIWYKHTYNSQEDYWGWEWYQDATLEDGENYYLELNVTPGDGYWIDKNTVFTVEGNVQPSWSNSFNGHAQATVDYDLRPVVSSIDLTTSGEPAYGATLSSVTVTAPAGVNYTVTPTWKAWDSDTGNYDAVTGNFGYGEYRLELEILPVSGYSILPDVTPTINGHPYYDLGDWHMDDIDGNWENGFLLIWNTYIEPANGFIHSVDLSGAPESITAGGAMPTPTITVVDGDVTVTGTKWLNNEMQPVTGKFEDGKSYYLEVSLAAKAGYAFDGWVDAYMNDDNCDGFNVASDRATATVYVYYTLAPVIEKVELTVTEPVIGAAPGAVTLPGGAKFVFDSDESIDFPGYSWYDEEYQEFQQFEDGKKYLLEVYLLPAEGYEFADDVVVTINGKVIDESDFYCNGYNLSIGSSYSFKEVVESVDITMPNYQVGDVFKDEDITLPANVGCEVGYVGIYGNYTDPYTAIGKDRYTLNIELIAKEGYEFSDDCVVTINGKSASDQYGSGELQGVYYEFSLCEKITKVEFPAFPSVSVGDTIEYQILTTPTDANYVAYSDWYDADTNPFNGTIENQNAYYLQYIAEPAQGYEFSEDCVITVGGQVVDGILKRIDSSYLVVVKQYNFGMPVIDKVELTITAPAVGEKPNMTITLPNGAKYTAEDMSWIESKSGSTTGSDWNYVGRTNTFKAGYTYFAICPITAADGYIFAEDAEIYVNGKKVDIVVSQYGSYLLGSQGQLIYNFGELVSDYDDNPKTGVIGISALVAMMALSATAAGVIISKKKEF